MSGALQLTGLYPAARRSAAARVMHGVTIPDPYDWLGGEETPEMAAWLRAEESLTDRVIGGPERAGLESWIAGLLGAPHSFRIAERGSLLFFLHDDKSRQQPALMVRDGDAGAPRTIFEPDAIGGPGRHAIYQQAVAPSPDGAHVALAFAEAGGDAKTIALVETASGRAVDGHPPKTILPTIAWAPDGSGFYYNRNQGPFVDAPDRMTCAEGVYFHRVGTNFVDDPLIAAKGWDEAHVSLPAVASDGRFLFVGDLSVSLRQTALTLFALGADGHTQGDGRTLSSPGEGAILYLGDAGPESFFQIDFDSERGRIVAVDRRRPDRAQWRDVVRAGDEAMALSGSTLRSANALVLDDRLYVTVLSHARHRVLIFDASGAQTGEVPLPPIASVAGGGGERYGEMSAGRDGTLLFELWLHAHRQVPVRYRRQENRLDHVFPDEIDRAALATRASQIFVEAADGARIPCFVLEPGDAKSGPLPTLLYGYGGFGAAITPEFSADIPAWLKLGGRYVVANIRGGGEYGKAWHDAAKRRKRQVAFDDFACVARSLIERGLTTPARLAIRGLSNGGLLVGAVALQQPQLFAAVVAELPLLDALALGRDDWSRALAAEIGNPTDDERDFRAIRLYSPLHNVRASVARPAMLVLYADRDSQILADGARKFVATLQADGGGLALLRVVRGCGHTGWPRSATAAAVADEIAFLSKTLDAAFDWSALEDRSSP